MRVKNPIQEGDGDPRHGTANGYNNHYCRCAECREAWRVHRRAKGYGEAYYRRQGVKPMAEHLAEIEAEHGSEARYKGSKTRPPCRCVLCRKAGNESRQRRRKEVIAGFRPGPAVHGRSGYSNGCRCRVCLDAQVAHIRAWRAQRGDTDRVMDHLFRGLPR